MRTLKLRITAAAVALCMAVTQLNTGFAAAQSVSALASEVFIKNYSTIDVPQALGTLDASTPGQGPLLVHIQEAHGNIEGQKNIAAILDHLNKQYGVNTVFLEGDAFDLKPELLRNFSGNRDQHDAHLRQLLEEGVLTGPEMFTAFHAEAQGLGIEDLDLYRENGKVFAGLLQHQSEIENFLSLTQRRIERLQTTKFNSNLKKILKIQSDHDKGTLGFEAYLNALKNDAKTYLKLDLDHPREQIDWPMLLRIFTLQRLAKKFSESEYLKERAAFLIILEKILGQEHPSTGTQEHGAGGENALRSGDPALLRSSLFQTIKILLTQPAHEAQVSDPETELIFEAMAERLPENFPYQRYPNVNYRIGELLLQSELKSDRLMEEIEKLENLLTDHLAETQEEKNLIQLSRNFELTRKLLSLQLSDKDHQKISANPDQFKPAELFKGLSEFENQKGEEAQAADDFFDQAREFYRLAKARDEALIKNVERRMQAEGLQKAAVITGGFHSQPFEKYFSEKNYHYVRVTPRMSTDDGWKEYKNKSLNFLKDVGRTSRAEKSTFRLADETIGPEASIASGINSGSYDEQARKVWGSEYRVRGTGDRVPAQITAGKQGTGDREHGAKSLAQSEREKSNSYNLPPTAYRLSHDSSSRSELRTNLRDVSQTLFGFNVTHPQFRRFLKDWLQRSVATSQREGWPKTSKKSRMKHFHSLYEKIVVENEIFWRWTKGALPEELSDEKIHLSSARDYDDTRGLFTDLRLMVSEQVVRPLLKQAGPIQNDKQIDAVVLRIRRQPRALWENLADQHRLAWELKTTESHRFLASADLRDFKIKAEMMQRDLEVLDLQIDKLERRIWAHEDSNVPAFLRSRLQALQGDRQKQEAQLQSQATVIRQKEQTFQKLDQEREGLRHQLTALKQIAEKKLMLQRSEVRFSTSVFDGGDAAIQPEHIIFRRDGGKRHSHEPNFVFHFIQPFFDPGQAIFDFSHIASQIGHAFAKNPELAEEIFQNYFEFAFAGIFGLSFVHDASSPLRGVVDRGVRIVASASRGVNGNLEKMHGARSIAHSEKEKSNLSSLTPTADRLSHDSSSRSELRGRDFSQMRTETVNAGTEIQAGDFLFCRSSSLGLRFTHGVSIGSLLQVTSAQPFLLQPWDQDKDAAASGSVIQIERGDLNGAERIRPNELLKRPFQRSVAVTEPVPSTALSDERQQTLQHIFEASLRLLTALKQSPKVQWDKDFFLHYFLNQSNSRKLTRRSQPFWLHQIPVLDGKRVAAIWGGPEESFMQIIKTYPKEHVVFRDLPMDRLKKHLAWILSWISKLEEGGQHEENALVTLESRIAAANEAVQAAFAASVPRPVTDPILDFLYNPLVRHLDQHYREGLLLPWGVMPEFLMLLPESSMKEWVIQAYQELGYSFEADMGYLEMLDEPQRKAIQSWDAILDAFRRASVTDVDFKSDTSKTVYTFAGPDGFFDLQVLPEGTLIGRQPRAGFPGQFETAPVLTSYDDFAPQDYRFLSKTNYLAFCIQMAVRHQLFYVELMRKYPIDALTPVRFDGIRLQIGNMMFVEMDRNNPDRPKEMTMTRFLHLVHQFGLSAVALQTDVDHPKPELKIEQGQVRNFAGSRPILVDEIAFQSVQKHAWIKIGDERVSWNDRGAISRMLKTQLMVESQRVRSEVRKQNQDPDDRRFFSDPKEIWGRVLDAYHEGRAQWLVVLDDEHEPFDFSSGVRMEKGRASRIDFDGQKIGQPLIKNLHPQLRLIPSHSKVLMEIVPILDGPQGQRTGVVKIIIVKAERSELRTALKQSPVADPARAAINVAKRWWQDGTILSPYSLEMIDAVLTAVVEQAKSRVKTIDLPESANEISGSLIWDGFIAWIRQGEKADQRDQFVSHAQAWVAVINQISKDTRHKIGKGILAIAPIALLGFWIGWAGVLIVGWTAPALILGIREIFLLRDQESVRAKRLQNVIRWAQGKEIIAPDIQKRSEIRMFESDFRTDRVESAVNGVAGEMSRRNFGVRAGLFSLLGIASQIPGTISRAQSAELQVPQTREEHIAALRSLFTTGGGIHAKTGYPLDVVRPGFKADWTQPTSIGFRIEELAHVIAGDLPPMPGQDAAVELERILKQLDSDQQKLGWNGLLPWMKLTWMGSAKDRDEIAYVDNANLTVSLMTAGGSLFRAKVKNPKAEPLIQQIQKILDRQRAGYQQFFDPVTGQFYRSRTRGAWQGHIDRLFAEHGGKTAAIVTYFGLNESAFMKLDAVFKNDIAAPWDGGGFQMSWFLPYVISNPQFKIVMENFLRTALAEASRLEVPGLLSASMIPGTDRYDGKIGHTVRDTADRVNQSAGSLYSLDMFYSLAPETVLAWRNAILQKKSDLNGPHGNYDSADKTGRVSRNYLAIDQLSSILGLTGRQRDSFLTWMAHHGKKAVHENLLAKKAGTFPRAALLKAAGPYAAFRSEVRAQDTQTASRHLVNDLQTGRATARITSNYHIVLPSAIRPLFLGGNDVYVHYSRSAVLLLTAQFIHNLRPLFPGSPFALSDSEERFWRWVFNHINPAQISQAGDLIIPTPLRKPLQRVENQENGSEKPFIDWLVPGQKAQIEWNQWTPLSGTNHPTTTHFRGDQLDSHLRILIHPLRSEARSSQPFEAAHVLKIYDEPRVAVLLNHAPSGRLDHNLTTGMATWDGSPRVMNYHSPAEGQPVIKRSWEDLEGHIPEAMRGAGPVDVYSYGNLYFNDWFVLFNGADQKLYRRAHEPWKDRSYSMLVVWNPALNRKPSSEDLRFEAGEGETVKVYRKSDAARAEHLGGQIQFAIFGQRLIHEGADTAERDWGLQFADLFHLFKFPQFVQTAEGRYKYGTAFGSHEMEGWRRSSPETFLKVLETGRMEIDLSPYLDQPAYPGEAHLRSQPKGAERIKNEALGLRGYREAPQEKSFEDFSPGEYRLEGNRLQVRLLPFPMPHTLIGLTQSGKVVSLVFTGDKMAGVGVAVQDLAARSRALYQERAGHDAAASDPLRELFLLSNSRDALRRVYEDGQGRFAEASRQAYPSATAAIAIRSVRSETRAGAGESWILEASKKKLSFWPRSHGSGMALPSGVFRVPNAKKTYADIQRLSRDLWGAQPITQFDITDISGSSGTPEAPLLEIHYGEGNQAFRISVLHTGEVVRDPQKVYETYLQDLENDRRVLSDILTSETSGRKKRRALKHQALAKEIFEPRELQEAVNRDSQERDLLKRLWEGSTPVKKIRIAHAMQEVQEETLKLLGSTSGELDRYLRAQAMLRQIIGYLPATSAATVSAALPLRSEMRQLMADQSSGWKSLSGNQIQRIFYTRAGLAPEWIRRKHGKQAFAAVVHQVSKMTELEQISMRPMLHPELVIKLRALPELSRLLNQTPDQAAEIPRLLFNFVSATDLEPVNLAPMLIYLAAHPSVRYELLAAGSESEIKKFRGQLSAFSKLKLGFDPFEAMPEQLMVRAVTTSDSAAAWIRKSLSNKQGSTAIITVDADRYGAARNLIRVRKKARGSSPILPLLTASEMNEPTHQNLGLYDEEDLTLRGLMANRLETERQSLRSFLSAA